MCTTYLNTLKRRLQAFRRFEAVRCKHFAPRATSQKMGSVQHRHGDVANRTHRFAMRSRSTAVAAAHSGVPAQTLCLQGFARVVRAMTRPAMRRLTRRRRRFLHAIEGLAIARVDHRNGTVDPAKNRLQKNSEKFLREDPFGAPNSRFGTIDESPPFRPRHRQHSATLRRTLALSERGGDD